MATGNELQRENILRQSGVSREAADVDDIKFDLGAYAAAPQADASPFAGLDAIYSAPFSPRESARMMERDYLDNIAGNRSGIAAGLGYGADRRDMKYSLDDFIRDPDMRARTQTGASKLVNGIMKLGTTAGTTFLDAFGGTLAGLLNVGRDLVDGDGHVRPLESFTNNPVSAGLQELNRVMEDVFPNHRTQAEMSDPWYRHLNANFWGDSVLKNIGFTVGAMAGGYASVSSGLGEGANWLANNVTSRIARKAADAASRKAARDLFKGAAAAAGGSSEAARLLSQPARSAGEAMDNYRRAAKLIRSRGLATQLIGSAGAAMSEARIEAVNAATEFAEDLTRQATEAYQRKMSLINPSLSDEQRRELADQYYGEYMDDMAFIDRQSAGVAGRTFILNSILLTRNDYALYGDLFTRGFKTGRRYLSNVAGGLGRNGGRIVAWYAGKGSVVGDYASALRPVITEGAEEMAQKVFSEHAKDMGRMGSTEFNDDAYDRTAIRSFWDTVGDVVGDVDSWEEFAIGALTGLVGIPSRRLSTWNGGEAEARVIRRREEP